ncbi:MAG: peptidoglycan DD-metalloendopeptidase family protein [Oleiphilaceae bacterium]|nr:peptidoglycan DD-metalloendopeptidase family protein [Oleiphilaceae bacterium]
MDEAYNARVTWGRHVVSSGETLSGIARRYGWDYRQLAAANDIDAPYILQPGQIIHLDKEVPSRVASAPTASPRSQGGSPPVASASSSPSSEQKKKPQTVRPSASRHNKALQSDSGASSVSDWQWPHLGPIIAVYSPDTDMNKGVDIGGDEGDPVRAAAAGNVVYAGSGLLGYGKLIIVNHNAQYLSAYAHNRTILVNEGDDVSQGQQIAEMGDTGASRVKLHFEIRKNGEPVDPQRYLPKR